MIVKCKVSFQKNDLYVDCNLNDVKVNYVIIFKYNTFEYIGTITSVNVPDNIKPNATILRIATKKDIKNNLLNIKSANEALLKCKRLIKKYNLDMRLLSANYSYDKKQLLFQYIADERVDFRKLAKDLASIYKTRIELRQIGIRDKAATVSGIGMCGRELCCAKFLNSIETVSINMAKNQHLALNPSKINGCCGRLLCCLNYEDEMYKSCIKDLPNVGDVIDSPNGNGKVVSIQILERKYKVDLGNNEIVEISLDEDIENGSSS